MSQLSKPERVQLFNERADELRTLLFSEACDASTPDVASVFQELNVLLALRRGVWDAMSFGPDHRALGELVALETVAAMMARPTRNPEPVPVPGNDWSIGLAIR